MPRAPTTLGSTAAAPPDGELSVVHGTGTAAAATSLAVEATSDGATTATSTMVDDDGGGAASDATPPSAFPRGSSGWR